MLLCKMVKMVDLFFGLFIWFSVTTNTSLGLDYFPPYWSDVCTHNITGNISTSNSVRLHCSLDGTEHIVFRLKDLHDYSVNVTGDVRYSVDINCVSSGNLTMRWPMKIDKLIDIKVTDCSLFEYMNDWNNQELEGTKDNLEVFELVNCQSIIDINYLASSIQNIENSSREWDCGHDETIRKMILRNFSMDFIMDMYDPDIINILTDGDLLFDFMRRIDKLESNCNFLKLDYMEETYSLTTSKTSLQVMKIDSEYPFLKTLNFSHNGFNDIPPPLENWYVDYPSLKYLDLSYNRIDQVSLTDYSGPRRGKRTVIDVRHNIITVVPLKDLKIWSLLTNTLVDIRENPLDCGCLEQDFIDTIQSSDFFTGGMAPYKYIQNMTCASPDSAKGIKLGKVKKVEMGCVIPPDDLTVYLVVLGILAAILILVIIVTFRYRREIKIILYIRFHILFPWDIDDNQDKMDYDAFISYCSSEEDWVYDVLQPKMETPENGEPSFKLCLHQRDFIGGKNILDNITDSIDNSRHTILILSRSFLKSMWGLQEFRYAYQESITKKRRHLIIVLFEDIPEAEMDSVLKCCIKTFTYLDVKDTMFLDRLRFALAAKSHRVRFESSVTLDSQLSQCSGDSGCVVDDPDIDICENSTKDEPDGNSPKLADHIV